MALHDDIQSEITAGRLQFQWTTADLKANAKLSAKYKSSTLGSDPPNRSVSLAGLGLGDGFHVHDGATPAYVRVGRKGHALLFSLGEGTIKPQVNPCSVSSQNSNLRIGETNQSICGSRAQSDAAKRFVEFLRESPFRIRMKNGKGFEWYPHKAPAIGWDARLNAYKWKQANWNTTKVALDKFVKSLAALEQEYKKEQNKTKDLRNRGEAIYREIAKWGGTRQGDAATYPNAIDRIVDVWGGNITQVDSTLTKVYALARPNEYVIYDSRVATAILRIAEYMYPVKSTQQDGWIDTVKDFSQAFPHIGLFKDGGTDPARGGRRVMEVFRWSSGWPDAYRQCGAQLDANCLCRMIVDKLNQSNECGRNNWTMREVEAVLFMEGY